MKNSNEVKPISFGKLSSREERFLEEYIEDHAISVAGEIDIIVGKLSSFSLIEQRACSRPASTYGWERTAKGNAHVKARQSLSIPPGVVDKLSGRELRYIKVRWPQIFREKYVELC